VVDSSFVILGFRCTLQNLIIFVIRIRIRDFRADIRLPAGACGSPLGKWQGQARSLPFLALPVDPSLVPPGDPPAYHILWPVDRADRLGDGLLPRTQTRYDQRGGCRY
jgi:hypothetical protein